MRRRVERLLIGGAFLGLSLGFTLGVTACATAPSTPQSGPVPGGGTAGPVMPSAGLDLSTADALRESFLRETAALDPDSRTLAAAGLLILGYNGARLQDPDLPPFPVRSPAGAVLDAPAGPFGAYQRALDQGRDRLRGKSVLDLVTVAERVLALHPGRTVADFG
ncbi:MAG: hypothetical protein WBG08_12375 [Litorimonas sp.]